MIDPLAVAALAATVSFTAVATLAVLLRSLLASESAGQHKLAAATTTAYRPRDWDTVTAETPITAPVAPEPEPEPIDELDPRWDWRKYADANEMATV